MQVPFQLIENKIESYRMVEVSANHAEALASEKG